MYVIKRNDKISDKAGNDFRCQLERQNKLNKITDVHCIVVVLNEILHSAFSKLPGFVFVEILFGQ